MKGLFGGAEANLGHRGIGLETRRLRNNIFRVEFIGTDDALEVNAGVEGLAAGSRVSIGLAPDNSD